MEPTSSPSLSRADLEARYRAAGQSHVFASYDALTDSQQQCLLEQLRGLPPIDTIREIFLSATKTTSATSTDSLAAIEPYRGVIGRYSCDSCDDSSDAPDNSPLERYRQAGLRAISEGQVAAVVMAGGQGTRLGFDGPKGLYDIGLPSRMSLFELQARRIAKLQQLAKEELLVADVGPSSSSPVIPFYVMTSPLNHDATIQHFQQHDHFGLSRDDVFFFRQGMLPCLNLQGKIIMESPGQLAMAPNGNGGLYTSLHESGALDDMRRRGVTCLNVFSVDNALVRPADPVFVGYCIEQQADVGNKVVRKLHPHEPVGVLANKSNKPCVVEYSEITPDMAEQVDASTGQLVYGAANIANHYFTVDFIQHQVLNQMQDMFHAAHKKIPHWDIDQQTTITKMESPNGIKLEAFIFDAFALSSRMAVWQVGREDEFAPVKNATGPDSPRSARQLLSHQFQRWIVAAGGTLKKNVEANAANDEDEDEDPLVCEIMPSTSYAGEGLERIVQERGGVVECPFVL